MLIKGVIEEDFLNYKYPSQKIEFPYFTFKCDKEYGQKICQNSSLVNSPNIKVNMDYLVTSYLHNPITEAIVFQGLEPFDSWNDMLSLIDKYRQWTNDDIVIYTGYTKEELEQNGHLTKLKNYDNIILKMGRYIPNQPSRYDSILGVTLASDNQYAERIS